MKTILILGANGRIGSAAAQAFHAAGWRVVSQVRRASTLPGAVAIPLAGTEALAAAAAGASVVLYAVNPAYTDWSGVPAMFDQGLAVARQLGARLFFPGNIYNHGEGMPALIDEHTPMRPTTDKGRIRVALEQRFRTSGVPGVVLRAGDFFGAASGTWFDGAITKDLARGRLVYPGPTDRAHAWAYLPDLAQAFVALAEADTGPGVEDVPFPGHTLTGQQLLDGIEAAAAELGLRPPQGLRRGTLPWPLLRLVGVVHPMLRELARMRYLFTVPHALDGRRLAALLGAPAPHTPLPEALRATLQVLGYR